MKIAFLHPENQFTVEFLRELKPRLARYELLSWTQGENAPARDLEVILVMGNVKREQMSDQPKLSLIQTITAGYEGVDIDAASELGIWVSFAPSEVTGNAASVAEFAVLLMLGASRHLNQALQFVRDHSVEPPRLNPAMSGKTVCILGLGGVGRLLVDRLRPFGMRILATDEHPERAPDGVKAFPADQLKAAIAQADYVIVCVRASRENENLINADCLAAMKRGAILINIAGGTLIDESALYASVKSGQVSAAGLDVLKTGSVDAKNKLLELPQIMITPHVAGATDLMLHGTVDYISQVIDQIASGDKPKSILNASGKPRRPLRESSK